MVVARPGLVAVGGDPLDDGVPVLPGDRQAARGLAEEGGGQAVGLELKAPGEGEPGGRLGVPGSLAVVRQDSGELLYVVSVLMCHELGVVGAVRVLQDLAGHSDVYGAVDGAVITARSGGPAAAGAAYLGGHEAEFRRGEGEPGLLELGLPGQVQAPVHAGHERPVGSRVPRLDLSGPASDLGHRADPVGGLAVAAARPLGAARSLARGTLAAEGALPGGGIALEAGGAASAAGGVLEGVKDGVAMMTIPAPAARKTREARSSNDGRLGGRVSIVRKRLGQLWIKCAGSLLLEAAPSARTTLVSTMTGQRG